MDDEVHRWHQLTPGLLGNGFKVSIFNKNSLTFVLTLCNQKLMMLAVNFFFFEKELPTLLPKAV